MTEKSPSELVDELLSSITPSPTFSGTSKSSILPKPPSNKISFYSPYSPDSKSDSGASESTLATLGLTPSSDSDKPRSQGRINVSPTLHDAVRLATLGIPPAIIARMLGLSTITINNYLKSQAGIELSSELQHAADENAVYVRRVISDAALRATQVLYESMTAPDSTRSEQIRASIALLDRAGHVPPSVSFLNVNRTGLSSDDIEQLKSRASEALKNAVSSSAKSCAPLLDEPNRDNKICIPESIEKEEEI